MPVRKLAKVYICTLENNKCKKWQCDNINTLKSHWKAHHQILFNFDTEQFMNYINDLYAQQIDETSQSMISQKKKSSTKYINKGSIISNNSTINKNKTININNVNNIYINNQDQEPSLADYCIFKEQASERLQNLYNSQVFDSKSTVEIVAKALHSQDKKECYLRVTDASRQKFTRIEFGKKIKDDGTQLYLDVSPILNDLVLKEKNERNIKKPLDIEATNEVYESIKLCQEKKRPFIAKLIKLLPSMKLIDNDNDIRCIFKDSSGETVQQHIDEQEKCQLYQTLDQFKFNETIMFKYIERDLKDDCLHYTLCIELICEWAILTLNARSTMLLWHEGFQSFVLKVDHELVFLKSLKDFTIEIDQSLMKWCQKFSQDHYNHPKFKQICMNLCFRGEKQQTFDKLFKKYIDQLNETQELECVEFSHENERLKRELQQKNTIIDQKDQIINDQNLKILQLQGDITEVDLKEPFENVFDEILLDQQENYTLK